MDNDEVRELLKKYWEGDTELSEENSLKEFFTQANSLTDDLKIYQDVFRYFKQEEKIPELNDDLAEGLKNYWQKPQEEPVKKLPVWKKTLKWAAIIIPLIVAGYFILNRKQNEQIARIQTDSFDNPEKAIAETEKTLLLLSKNLSDGMAQMKTFKLVEELKNSKKFKEQNIAQKNKP